LNERILKATLGTDTANEMKAPWTSRAASRLRLLLDPIVSPQLVTVATMLLVAILVLTNTVSADGSIGGIYNASLELAERTTGSAAVKQFSDDLKLSQEPAPAPQQKSTDQQKDQNKSGANQHGGQK
jgi:hypothetical protein